MAQTQVRIRFEPWLGNLEYSALLTVLSNLKVQMKQQTAHEEDNLNQ